MNSKVIAAIIAVVAVVIVALAAIGAMDDDDNHITEGVVYDGNGGLCGGNARMELTNHEVMSNPFENGNLEFVSWNTKADGSGTTYKPGDHIDYASNRTVTLYAQWQEPGPYVSGFSYSETDGVHVAATLNGKALNMATASFIPLTPANNVIGLKYDGDAKWILDADSNKFSIVIGTNTYTVTVTVTNATGVEYTLDGDGNPELTFSTDRNVSISLSVKQPR